MRLRLWLATVHGLGVWLRGLFERHWKSALRLRDHLGWSEEAIQLLLAAGVGIIGGFSNLAFYLSGDALQQLALRHTGDMAGIAEIFGWWQRMAAPALGGLAAGLVLYWGFRLVGKTGPSNLLEVVVAGDGRLPLRAALINAVSSIISISSGASIGREGMITQLTAAVASKWGQIRGWEPYRLRLLVGCGAAAGMAAAYNAPLGGAVFAAQIVLGSFSMHLFAPLVLSALVATMVSRSFFGIAPWYFVPNYAFTSLGELPWFILLGVVCGVLGAAFLRSLQLSERWIQSLGLPLYGRLALAGGVVGAISLLYPEVWGNGYGATNRMLKESLPPDFMGGLFLAKILATVVTVGAGTVGGVFTPTLFLGAACGCACGSLLHWIGWASGLPTGVFALAGMGGVLAATTHSPLLAMIMVFELSLNYSLMPAIMLACAVATLVGRRLHPASIYTEPLRAKGIEESTSDAKAGADMQRTVGDFMRKPVPPVLVTAPFREIAERFLANSHNFLPVVDNQNRLAGMIALHDMKEYLNAQQEFNSVIAFDIMRPPPPVLTPGHRLLDVLPILLGTDLRNLPVVSSQTEPRLVGSLVRAEALGMFSEAIAARTRVQA